MYSPEPDDVYRAARAYLPNLPDGLRSLLQELLGLAEAGEKVDNRIIDLMADDNRAREWMRAALFGDSVRTFPKASDQLGGDQKPISARKWTCQLCDFSWYVYRTGQPVPPCPNDLSALVPADTRR